MHLTKKNPPGMKTREAIEDILPFLHPDVLAKVSSLSLTYISASI